jgi:hypothetical protein
MHTCAERQDMITVIQRLPADLEVAVKGLNEQQLGTPYREGGWTVRQVVHHLADAHMNGFKLGHELLMPRRCLLPTRWRFCRGSITV